MFPGGTGVTGTALGLVASVRTGGVTTPQSYTTKASAKTHHKRKVPPFVLLPQGSRLGRESPNYTHGIRVQKRATEEPS